jgi:chemotaxis protein MotB
MSDSNSDENDPNAWMVTFGDLIMLLLTFFVLLLTMKSMAREDTNLMFDYFIEAEGTLDPGGVDTNENLTEENVGKRKKALFITSSAMLKKTLKKDFFNFRNYYTVSEDSRGLVMTLDSEHLFESGQATIRPEGKPVLDIMGRLLRNVSNDVLVLGHTDSTPVRRGRFRSNWDLSTYRALNVFDYLTDTFGLDARHLAPGGCGDTRPAVPNNSPENRAKNRRVEFILKQ